MAGKEGREGEERGKASTEWRQLWLSPGSPPPRPPATQSGWHLRPPHAISTAEHSPPETRRHKHPRPRQEETLIILAFHSKKEQVEGPSTHPILGQLQQPQTACHWVTNLDCPVSKTGPSGEEQFAMSSLLWLCEDELTQTTFLPNSHTAGQASFTEDGNYDRTLFCYQYPRTSQN